MNLRPLPLLLLAACGLSTRATRGAVDEARLARARELSAETRAPEPYRRYTQAQRAAAASPSESGARGDLEAESRLWLEVALAESEIEALSASRLEAEKAQAALDAAIVRVEQERDAVAGMATLRAAQALARTEAARSLAMAARRPSLRVKLPREDERRAAESLLLRAELIALTLETYAAPPSELAQLRAKIGEARALAPRDPAGALARADALLFQSLALLSTRRESREAPTDTERASLAEALRAAGLHVEGSDEGLRARLERAFAQQALTPGSPRVIERICALGRAHPHGPVLLAVSSAHPGDAATRMRVVRVVLAQAGCRAERFQILGAGEGDDLEARFPAY